MASIFKPTYTYTDPKTGKKEKRKLAKWYVKYRNAEGLWTRVPGFRDKGATYELAAKLEREVELAQRGFVDPYLKYRNTPLTEHLEDFKRHLQDKGDTSKHVSLICDRVNAVLAYCSFAFSADVSGSGVLAFLGNLRAKDKSIETCNHYLSAIKQFMRWLVIENRIANNPVSHLKKQNSKTDRRHDRRSLSDEEFARLIAAAELGPPVEGVSGPERAIMYCTAAWTGFRRSELASLTGRSFELDGPSPVVRLQAIDSKNRKGAIQPLHVELAQRLKAWLATKQLSNRDVPVFPLRTAGGQLRRTSKMMQRDLQAARMTWLEEVDGQAEELLKRNESDFLRYRTAGGLYADFHSNRHTFISNLGKSGVPLSTAQKLARHEDPKLTANVYTHIGAAEQAKAIGSLPAPPPLGSRSAAGIANHELPHDQQHAHAGRESWTDTSRRVSVRRSTSESAQQETPRKLSLEAVPSQGMAVRSKTPEKNTISSKPLTSEPRVAGSNPAGRIGLTTIHRPCGTRSGTENWTGTSSCVEFRAAWRTNPRGTRASLSARLKHFQVFAERFDMKFPQPWYRKSRRAWYVTLDGQQIRLGTTKDESLAHYQRLMAAPRNQTVATGSLTGIIDAFLDWVHRNRASDTYEWYRYRLQRLVDAYPDLLVADIKPFHIERWVNQYDLSTTSRRNYLRSIKRCLKWARSQGFIRESPLADLEVPSAESREVTISQDEFDQLLQSVRCDQLRDLLVTTWDTGCRPQESLRVEARHVDLERQRWVFPRSESKMRQGARVVYLTDRVNDITRRLVERYPQGTIFRNSRGNAWTTEAVNCSMQALRVRIGKQQMKQLGVAISTSEIAAKIDKLSPTKVVKGTTVTKTQAELRCEAKRKLVRIRARDFAPAYSLYALRHSWATNALKRGVDPLTVAILMGHRDPSTLARVYQHLSLSPDHLLDQAKRAAG